MNNLHQLIILANHQKNADLFRNRVHHYQLQ